MRRSPLNTPSGPSRRRHMTYDWSTHQNTNRKGYHSVNNGNYQSFPANNGPQTCGDDFIPLNVSTPITRYKKFSGNWHNSGDGRNNAATISGTCNYRNNYQSTPRPNYNTSYSPYKHSNRQFYGQRKGNKGAHRHVNISEYVDVSSFLEDPWEGLIKKLNNSKGTCENEVPKIESLLNTDLSSSNSAEKFGSRYPGDTNVNDMQCSQQIEIDSSIDVSCETEDINVTQTSKGNSSVDLEIGSLCFVQESFDESTGTIDDNTSEVTEEKHDVHSGELQIDTDKKDI